MSSSYALRAASALAKDHPDALLPCPRCAASVKGANLLQHLRKVHDQAPDAGAPADGYAPLVLRGTDGRLRPVLLVLLVLCGLTFGATITLVANPSAVVLPLFAALVLPLALALARELSGRVPATLTLDDNGVRLAGPFGVAVRTLPYTLTLTSGALLETRVRHPAFAWHDAEGEHVQTGMYVQLTREGRRITAAARKTHGLGKHWAPNGWVAGAAARRFDVRLSSTDMVLLTYVLAGRGLLTAK
jgi:hypothetical protein